MRTLALVVLLAPALAAQPSASDSALVDRVVIALGMSTEGDLFDDEGAPSGVSGAIRAAFLGDLDADLLSDALVVLESPAYGRVDSTMQALTIPFDASGNPSRADSALVANYFAAQSATVQHPSAVTAIFEDARRNLPASARATFDSLGVWDEIKDNLASPFGSLSTAETAALVDALRVQFSDTAPADLEAVTAYYRSPAGHYVGRQTTLAAYRFSVPLLVKMMSMTMLNDDTLEGLYENNTP